MMMLGRRLAGGKFVRKGAIISFLDNDCHILRMSSIGEVGLILPCIYTHKVNSDLNHKVKGRCPQR
jgi:hypothetical protein